MTIFSHQGVLLVDHLQKVAGSCRSFIARSFKGSEDLIPGKILTDIGFICGAFHDIGKATRFFQHYLNTRGEVNGPKSHALISALFVRQIVVRYLNAVGLPSRIKHLLAAFSFIAVKRHHGGILNLEDETLLSDKSKELNEIIVAFYKDETQEIIDHFLKEIGISYDFDDFIRYIQGRTFEKELVKFYMWEIKGGDYDEQDLPTKIQLFYSFQLLYSSLLLSDKDDVIVKGGRPNGSELDIDCLEKYRAARNFDKQSEGRETIDDLKNRAYYQALSNLRRIYNPRQYIYSVTLPTGFGKTMTSFGVALEMMKLNPSLERLIISIPFTSIIDQNFDVYQSIVGSDDSSLILKHHHQAQPSYKAGEEELEPEKSQFLIETWQSLIVVTTFVQLLDSIFSADKGLLMKIPNMANSVIILDEVQTINFKHWPLIREVFSELGQLLNCYFILMSATQPLIFVPEKEIIEIVPDYQSYFRFFNRTRIINKSSEAISQEDFVHEICSYARECPQKDILVILNTKKSCRDVFKRLRDELDHDKCNLFFMSTLITPFERKQIIGKLKEECDAPSKQKIVVTTQLIEAGVDISVDTVFRVLAPIDSIIQSAGRANRYNEKGYICDIFLFEVEESKSGTSFVYGADLIQKTKNVLQNISVIEESNYLSLIEAYFREVRDYSNGRVTPFIGNIERLEFASLGQFLLIEERDSESIFVQLNSAAKEVWVRFLEIYNDTQTSIFEKRLEFARIKSEFYNYVVNVPVPLQQWSISFDSDMSYGFYLVELNKPTPFYSYSPDNFLENIGYTEVDTIFS